MFFCIIVNGVWKGWPIGLCSSPVIANWYLREFDTAILKKIRPAYYGRYVDDIFMVVASETAPEEASIEKFINRLLIAPQVLQKKDTDCYEILARPGLFLQQEKCTLQFFDSGH